MSLTKSCDKCNKRSASHTIHKWWETPSATYVCCECYVNDGNLPAEWHPLCMITYKINKLKHTTVIIPR